MIYRNFFARDGLLGACAYSSQGQGNSKAGHIGQLQVYANGMYIQTQKNPNYLRILA